MVTSAATSPGEYVKALPVDRRATVSAVRAVVNDHLPDGFVEGMLFGMISWHVPLERFADTYNGQPLSLAALASQKNHLSLYLNDVYGNRETEAWFRERWTATGKALNMGKSCIRFRRIGDIPLEVIAETISRTDVQDFIERYRASRGSSRLSRLP